SPPPGAATSSVFQTGTASGSEVGGRRRPPAPSGDIGSLRAPVRLPPERRSSTPRTAPSIGCDGAPYACLEWSKPCDESSCPDLLGQARRARQGYWLREPAAHGRSAARGETRRAREPADRNSRPARAPWPRWSKRSRSGKSSPAADTLAAA